MTAVRIIFLYNLARFPIAQKIEICSQHLEHTMEKPLSRITTYSSTLILISWAKYNSKCFSNQELIDFLLQEIYQTLQKLNVI